MAYVQSVVRCEIDPFDPVAEICAVIMAVTPYHPGQEDEILQGIKEAIENRQVVIKKGDEQNEQVRGNNRKQEDK